MGFSSQKFCTERFLFRVNIDCVFLHNNFIKNINYLPKTVNQTRYILFSYLLDFSRSLCKGAPQKVNEWWKKFFSCPIIIFSLSGRTATKQQEQGGIIIYLSRRITHDILPAYVVLLLPKKGLEGTSFR